MAQEPAVTPYGVKSPSAPDQLSLFSFLIGKWEGTKTVPLPDGTVGPVTWTWIGRYILDGAAIADELHVAAPSGSLGLGVSIRRFDPQAQAWIVEFINVTNAFIRRQVNPRSGSVTRDANTVVVTGEDGDQITREAYELSGDRQFVYRLDISKDRGKTWDTGLIEMTMTRVE
jgi:hypothetical protein